MAEKKFLSDKGLKELIGKIKSYDAASFSLAKEYVDEKVDASKITVDTALSDTSTNPVQNKVVKSSIDSMKSYADSEIAKVTSGTVVVKEAEHADHADTANESETAKEAKHAETADRATFTATSDSATKATQDGNGNVISETYQTVADATSQHNAIQSSIDAKVPTSRTINGKTLASNITLSASDVGAATTAYVDTAESDANEYTDNAIANLLNNSTEAVDSIYELRDAMETNADAIEALKSIASSKANASDLTSHTGNKSNPHGVTAAQVGAYTKAEIDSKVSTLNTNIDKKMGDFTIEIYNNTKGNPKPVRFASFNYSTCVSEEGIAAKISLVSGHGNGTSYAFLEDVIIRINYLGNVEADNFKYYGADASTYDGVKRQYGDIFWLVDKTNKIVDFYVLMGQYSRVQQTPWKRLTYSSKGSVAQHTSCTVYSSGEKNWANNDEIATKNDIPENADLSVYAKKATTLSGYGITDAYDKSAVDESLSKKANVSDIPTVPTNVSAFTNDAGYLKAIPSEYITETELSAKGYLTAVPSEYVTESELNAKKYLTSVPSEYVTETGLSAKAYATQANLDAHTGNGNAHITSTERTKLANIEAGAQVNTITGVKGGEESTYRTGTVNITAANIGLENVNNTSDANKPVSTAQQAAIDSAEASALADAKTYADGLNTAMDTRMDAAESKLSGIAAGANKTVVDTALSSTSTNPVQNRVVNSALSAKVPTSRTINGKALDSNITLNYSDVGADQSGAANSALASAKSYADEAATTVKNDLLNGAGGAYDTLKELGELIDTNKNAIDALNTVAAGKANASHSHGNITNAGAIGTAANKAVITTTNGVLTTGTVPVASGGTGSTTAAGALTNLGLTATASELNVLDGITATTAELNYVDGVTSSIQSQLDSKASSTTVSNHIGDSTHISSTERTNWNAAKTHADTAHAPSNAEKNQNAFSNVTVGNTTIAADSTTDTLTLIAGSNVTITPDATNDNITIAAKDTVYTHPTYTSKGNGFYKVTVDGTGHVSGTAAVAKSDITALGIPAQDTTYSNATTSSAGLMSSGDKTKLNGIATGAEVNQNAFSNVVVNGTTIAADSKTDSLTLIAGSNVTLSPDSTNDSVTITAKDTVYTHPTTAGNKHIPAGGSSGQILRWSSDGTAVWGADNNTTYSAATQSADGLMSADDKIKLDGIARNANNYTYTLPAATSSALGGVKIGSNITNSSGTISLTKANVTAALGYTPPTTDTNTNTTYDLAASASSTNGNVKLNLTAGGSGSGTDSVTIKGTGGASVTTDSSGVVTVNAPSAYSHPNTVTAGTVSGSSGSISHGGSISIPSITYNANGHITSTTTTSVTLPSQYSLPSAGSSLGGVKSGGDVTISSGVITVNDDSHAHVISNVDGLQSALDGKAASSHTHTGLQAVTTAGTGAAYTATVEGITSLTKGVNFIMIPHTQSTTKTPTLNVNGLGAKTIQRYVSANDYSTEGYNESWLQTTRPVLVIYSGTYWYVQAMDKPAAYDLRGTVPIASGGTGGTTAAEAVSNLGGLSVVVSSTEPTNSNAAIWIQTS